MKNLTGVGASPGIAIGPVFHYKQNSPTFIRRAIVDPQVEIDRLESALAAAELQIQTVYEIAKVQSEKEELSFSAQSALLHSPRFRQDIHRLILEEWFNAEAALVQVCENYATYQQEIRNEDFYIRTAATRDLANRILRILLGVHPPINIMPDQPVIIAARDLSPSDTIHLDKSKVLGFCMAEGSSISHMVILAKALGLPTVVGLGKDLEDIPNDTLLALDGERGEVVCEPDESVLTRFSQRSKKAQAFAAAEKRIAVESALTLDDYRVSVFANINTISDAQTALDFGAEGIGLMRTEYFFLDRLLPASEEEQMETYRAVIEVMEDRPVVVRTMDITAAPPPPYLDGVREDNPFLGSRGIRICLQRPEFFKVQLRALLRANRGAPLRILLPMVADLEEVRLTRELLTEAQKEVEGAGHTIHGQVQLGIMVEVPSTVTMADLFAREVDFFSIGTNDLTQYTMAAERTNPRLAHLHDSCHPAILRQVSRTIDAAHNCGIKVGLCGELAGDMDAVPILLGLGLDEFSMAASLIPRVKAIIRRWTFSLAQKTARETLDLPSAEAVRRHIHNLKAV